MSNLQRILKMASNALDKNGQSSTGSGKTDWRQIVRTTADKVTGDDRSTTASARGADTHQHQTASVSAEDRAAIARYDYLLKTAQPEQLESVHRDAFARLTPQQREQVNAQLSAELPANERPASSNADDLARSATRGEAHNPGFLRKLFAKPAGRGAAGAAGIGAASAVAGAGLGAAGGLLAAVAGGAILSSVAAPLLEQAAGMGVDFESLAGGFDGITEGATDYASGLGEQVSDLGSGFDIPGLSGLSNFFGRDN